MQEKIILFKIRTQKDEQAFAVIYEQHVSAVRRFLLMKLPRQEDAEDALSTTFLRVWNYLTSVEVESVSGLIFTITRGVVSDFYRTRGVETVPLEEGKEAKTETDKNLGEVALIKRAIDELDEETQLAMSLRFFEGKTVSEVSKTIQKSESATRMLLHRATKKLRLKFDR